MARPHHIIKQLNDQRGGAAILFVLCLPVLLGFAALAIDLTRINLTRVELQNAADAASLAGVHSISDTQPPPGLSDKPYNWSAAAASALDVARRNFANAALIHDALIETGYWNIQNPSLGLRAPGTPGVPAAGDVPAVRVTVAISSSQNNGPIAPVLGIAERNVQASAVAVLPAPSEGTGMFPMVIASSMFDHYWDSTTRRPKLDPATGKPYVIDVGNSYFGGVSGSWATFSTKVSDTPTMLKLIEQGNSTALSIGMNTWIPTGVHTSLYDDVPSNKDVAILVVNSVETGTYQTVTAIAGFHITGTVKISGKRYIRGNFIDNVLISTTSPGSGNGLPLGVYSPPILVN